MRVIAGSAGGVPLLVPKTDLRPTMDQVRAAIFSALGERVIGARVLDLFAGTGALGIEALSRGAASVVFVESERRAVETIRRNLEKTRLAGPAATVHGAEVFALLARGWGVAGPFDLVFADPPYTVKNPGADDPGARLLADGALPPLLAPGGLLVVEKAPGRPLPAGIVWNPVRQRRYGGTEVVFLELNVAPPGDIPQPGATS